MIVIVGAGCAGLSLAVRLAARPELGRVTVIEPRAELSSDRTFCFFRGRSHPFGAAVTHEWWRVRVAGPGHEVVRATRTPYQHLPADAFHRAALAALDACKHIELRMGTSAERIVEREGRVDVETSAGKLEARVVFDARGLAARDTSARAPSDASSSDAVGGDAVRGEVRWLQHFAGLHVRTERPIFEPDTATLMDFRVEQGPGPRFIYVLPYTAHEALVEDTCFSEAPLPAAEYDARVRAYLDARSPGEIEIVRREHGVIPMTTEPAPRATDRVVPLGLAGGLAKPSTGYHFAFAQRHADAIVEAMAQGKPLSRAAAPRTPVASFFDRVFLSYLSRHRERAPALFARLFDRVPVPVLARFLGESGGPLDHLRVMNAVARRGLFLEAMRTSASWMRRS